MMGFNWTPTPQERALSELEKRVTKLEEKVFLDDPSKIERETPRSETKEKEQHPCDHCPYQRHSPGTDCRYRTNCYDWRKWRMGEYDGYRTNAFFCWRCGQLMYEGVTESPTVHPEIAPIPRFHCSFCGAEC